MASRKKETWSVTILRDHLSEAMLLVLRPRSDRKSSHWAWQSHTVHHASISILNKHCNKLHKTGGGCNCLLKNTDCNLQPSWTLLKSPKHQMIKNFLHSTLKIILSSVYLMLCKYFDKFMYFWPYSCRLLKFHDLCFDSLTLPPPKKKILNGAIVGSLWLVLLT